MANRERGEIGVDVEGMAYTLRPTFNAVCELETLVGKSFDDVLAEIQSGRLSGLRATVWCLLQANHGEEIRTLSDAGDWIEKAGGPIRMLEVMNGVVEANSEPSPERSANPRKARAGTGGRSSSRLAKSA